LEQEVESDEDDVPSFFTAGGKKIYLSKESRERAEAFFNPAPYEEDEEDNNDEEESYAPDRFSQFVKYHHTLNTLTIEMGFKDRSKLEQLCYKHDGDLARVLNELLN